MMGQTLSGLWSPGFALWRGIGGAMLEFPMGSSDCLHQRKPGGLGRIYSFRSTGKSSTGSQRKDSSAWKCSSSSLLFTLPLQA